MPSMSSQISDASTGTTLPVGFFIGDIHVPVVALEACICIIAALVMMRLEVLRRAVGRPGDVRNSSYVKIIRECGPEAAGTLACLTLVAALRARGDNTAVNSEDSEAWEAIKAEWPILMTADTLLALQAMLRLVVLLSTVLRASQDKILPLADEAAFLMLCGVMARVAVATQSQAYMLEGPVGGMLPLACEVALILLLLVLARGSLRRTPLTNVLVIAAVWAFSRRNYLNFAEEEVANQLFVAAHCFEALGALAYLARTMLIENGTSQRLLGDVSIGFTHLLMPVQQGLAAYFWLTAFDADTQITGAGFGNHVVQIGCTAQLGVYLASAALYTADRVG
eukprot:TRINITY_DN80226_c0_g1_i1.p1 TRINITY_DN80226_c0_g1~~TRINITY_DN80226_c0_g1_i1.p1  ORF type:complete len:338 (+),score=75.50 TRINITY_DN80226_c0_g1_i1:82-1095(+)